MPRGFHTFNCFCNKCGKSYTAQRSDSRFCSGKCRVAACRERQRASKPTTAGKVRHYEPTVQVEVLVTCLHCNATFLVPKRKVNQVMYCSGACKQRAYRARIALGIRARRTYEVLPARELAAR